MFNELKQFYYTFYLIRKTSSALTINLILDKYINKLKNDLITIKKYGIGSKEYNKIFKYHNLNKEVYTNFIKKHLLKETIL